MQRGLTHRTKHGGIDEKKEDETKAKPQTSRPIMILFVGFCVCLHSSQQWAEVGLSRLGRKKSCAVGQCMNICARLSYVLSVVPASDDVNAKSNYEMFGLNEGFI